MAAAAFTVSRSYVAKRAKNSNSDFLIATCRKDNKLFFVITVNLDPEKFAAVQLLTVTTVRTLICFLVEPVFYRTCLLSSFPPPSV